MLFVLASLTGVSGCQGGGDSSFKRAQEARPILLPGASDGEFEMHIRFDAQGQELSRKCIQREEYEVAGSKAAKLKPIECPAPVVVTVGTQR
jgi:hypothetical protein